LGALTAFGSVAIDMYLPALPEVALALGTRPQHAEITISTFLFGLAVGQLAFGPLSDRLGRRGPLLAGIGLYLAASAVCGLAQSLGLMIVARLFQALGACAGTVIARAIVRDRYEHDEVLHVFSLLSLVFGLAPILAPLVGGWVLAAAGWRWIFGVQTAFAVVMGAFAYFLLPETRSQATRETAMGEHPLRSYLSLLRDRRLSGYMLTGSFSGAAMFAYITASPEIVISFYHVPPQHFGWVFGSNAAGLIGANQVNARLARRIPAHHLLRGALIVSALAAVGLLLCAWTGLGGIWGVLVPLFLVIASLGFVQPNTTAGAMNIDPSRAGSTAALIGATYFGIGSLTGFPMNWLHDGSARPLGIVSVAVLALALATFELLVRPASHSPIPSHASSEEAVAEPPFEAPFG
jgi:DHA1 family bicyclomycin/chloramphenicol resistance-like MFS transporter